MEVWVKGYSECGEGATSKLDIWYSNWRLFIINEVSYPKLLQHEKEDWQLDILDEHSSNEHNHFSWFCYDQYFYKMNISLVYLVVTGPFHYGYKL